MSFNVRKFSRWIFILVGLFLVFWVARAGYYGYQGYKWRKQTQAFEDALTKPLREDTYGGKTPEETWAMFLDALKKGDVELASKYFYVDKQKEYKKDFERLQTENKLESWIINFEKIRKSNNQPLSSKERYYSIDYYSKEYKTNLTERVVFLINPYINIWKIAVL